MRSKILAVFGLVCVSGFASAAMPILDISRPESVPVSLMSQFYGVQFGDIKVDSITLNSRGDEASVVASALDGHKCIMGVAKATTSSGAVGWMVSNLGCTPE